MALIIMLHFVKFICSGISRIWSYSNYLRISQIKSGLYTIWLSNEFKEIGENVTINSPIDLRGGKFISIGKNVSFGKNSVLNAWHKYKDFEYDPSIIIGDNCSFGEGVHITAINSIVIGNNVLMGRRILISDNSHGKFDNENILKSPATRELYSKGAVIIKDGVWIGDKATILAGVTIGENSIIGSNSVVTKDIPKNCVAGGVPAQIIKSLK